MENSVDSIRTTYHFMEWYAEHVVRVRIDDGAEIGMEEALASHEAMKKLTGGRFCILLIDVRNTNFNVASEVRAFASSEEGSSTRYADAILVDSLSNALVGNFYIRFNRPRIPTRIFKSEAKAMEWIKVQIEKAQKSSMFQV
ncbi:MAG: hypothetical protein FD123_3303 [Bacteroidetes bacterium]|nr:MAG: hypothetical protein FD123_3303 [Bacteroidota bacterium]